MMNSEHTKDAAPHTQEVETRPIGAPPLPTTVLAEDAALTKSALHEDVLADEQCGESATRTSPRSRPTSEAKAPNALAALTDMLDRDPNGPQAARHNGSALRSLQKMCMRVPHLSNELTRPQRFRLYHLLLIEDNCGVPGSDESTEHVDWTMYSKRALETHVHVAKQAKALFPEALRVTTDELAGLFYRLGAETGFYFHPEVTEIILCMTYVVAGGHFTEKDMLLHSLYRMLCALQKDFIVSASSHLYNSATASLLRLMLQFYDPQLATHMDQQQVNVGEYLLDWSRRLLVLQSDYESALKVLDWVFILGEPVMVPYVAHAYLITYRQSLLALNTKQALMERLDKMKFTLPSCKAEAVDPRLVDGRATAPTPVWSGKSLLQNADLLYRVTPVSTQRMLDLCLNPDLGLVSKKPEELQHYYDSAPCLPLERSDIASAFAKREAAVNRSEDEYPPREYIIVDCRSQESFDYLRLPTAVLVGDVLGYQHENLSEAMQRLESCRGHPLALFGTGRAIVEELNLLKIFALHLVNRNTFPFVCVVLGGFKTTIPLIREGAINVIMSSAAAASLQNPASRRSTSRIDWGQKASNTAHNISVALRGVSDYVAHVEGTEIKQKAEELGKKVQVGVSAAGSWGWGMIQRIGESLGETREQAVSVLSTVAGKHMAAQSAATNSSSSAPSGTTGTGSLSPAAPPSSTLKFSNIGHGGVSTAKAHPDAAFATQQPQQIFSLDVEGEEEDLDLITAIPAKPVRGTVVAESVRAPGEMASPATAASRSAAADLTSGLLDPLAPAVSPTIIPAPRLSDPLGGPPTSSGVAGVETGNRGASASQIAASIDAEFDELFGDLDVAHAATTGTAASFLSNPTSSGKSV
ncbi:hypothetical protein JKF63_02264 [Porcisia hertigi]|uniref:Rab-GAP TBC domain-containing protein n=1 Tax=Porcisia hertigi TaxID=2761500 RepID=A0A836HLY6_9TRYP|nr:hypothetical protein JKF63_02264 [Porcisia hertigi]